MRFTSLIIGAFAITVLSLAALARMAPAETPSNTTASPLILDKAEGERRVRRFVGNKMGTTPFILKVDPKNSGSQHLLMSTEDLQPDAPVSKRELDEIRKQHPHAVIFK
jgi:hypothetical protein